MPCQIDDPSGVREADVLVRGEDDDATGRAVRVQRRGEVRHRGDIECVEWLVEDPQPALAA